MTDTHRVTAPNGLVRVIHTVAAGAERALCGRSVAGWHRLPTDPWARVGAEHYSAGPCIRCASKA